MNYPLFRKQHLFVGSGVVEAGCKTVVGQRLKQSGMFWTVHFYVAHQSGAAQDTPPSRAYPSPISTILPDIPVQ
jgi:hypothetical protein